MTEKRFLSFLLTEGILLAALGLGMLILPKITTISFGLMLCLSLIIYGGYKIINAFFTRNYSRHFILNIFRYNYSLYFYLFYFCFYFYFYLFLFHFYFLFFIFYFLFYSIRQ